MKSQRGQQQKQKKFGNSDRSEQARKAQLTNPVLKTSFEEIKQEFESSQIRMSNENYRIFENAYTSLSSLGEITQEALALNFQDETYQAMNGVLKHARDLGEEFLKPENFIILAMLLSLSMMPTAAADSPQDWNNAVIGANPNGIITQENCLTGLTRLQFSSAEIAAAALFASAHSGKKPHGIKKFAKKAFKAIARAELGDEVEKLEIFGFLRSYDNYAGIFEKDQKNQELTGEEIRTLGSLKHEIEKANPPHHKPFREAALVAIQIMIESALKNTEGVSKGVKRLLELSGTQPIFGNVADKCRENLGHILSKLQQNAVEPQPQVQQEKSPEPQPQAQQENAVEPQPQAQQDNAAEPQPQIQQGKSPEPQTEQKKDSSIPEMLNYLFIAAIAAFVGHSIRGDNMVYVAENPRPNPQRRPIERAYDGEDPQQAVPLLGSQRGLAHGS